MPNQLNNIKVAFFGTPEFAVSVLNTLEAGGLRPSLVITNPDEPKGRKLVLTPPPAKVWAEKRGITVLQPAKLSTDFIDLTNFKTFDLFIVAAYGKIIPEEIINLPKYRTINIHPSLLPKYRGASPIQAAILNGDEKTGVSIMLLDKEMDHGPIISQEEVSLGDWRPYFLDLQEKMAEVGAKLLLRVLPGWIAGKIEAVPQNHAEATYVKKVKKEDGFVPAEELEETKVERIVRALNPDPGAYTILNNPTTPLGAGKRVKITRARLENDRTIIERVIPEGKKEMSWEDFKRGHKK